MKAAELAGTAYPSLYSGWPPAQHGLYFPYQWSAKHQRVRAWRHIVHPQTIFERIDQAGMRSVVIDPPEMNPIEMRHGFIVSGWQFESRVLLHRWSTSPSAARELAERYGPAKRADEVFGQPTAPQMLALRRVLLEAPARLEQAALHFLSGNQAAPDLLWLTFVGLHVAGHLEHGHQIL